jgi:hypothetical protein
MTPSHLSLSTFVYVLVVGAMECAEVKGVYATSEAATAAYTVNGKPRRSAPPRDHRRVDRRRGRC